MRGSILAVGGLPSRWHRFDWLPKQSPLTRARKPSLHRGGLFLPLLFESLQDLFHRGAGIFLILPEGLELLWRERPWPIEAAGGACWF